MSLVPMVVTKEGNSERVQDIYSRLLAERIICLNEDFNSMSCASIRSCLLHLDHESQEDISLYIDSPGGDVMSGLAVLDTMRIIRSKVNVTCTGIAASMGSVILAGATGKRQILPYSQVMIHQVSSGSQGTVKDMEVNFQHAYNQNILLKKFFCEATGQPLEVIERAFSGDTWLRPEEALELGVVDEIIAYIHKPRHEVDDSQFKLDKVSKHFYM